VFLDINQRATDVDDDAAFKLVMSVAECTDDVEEIAGRLRVTRR